MPNAPWIEIYTTPTCPDCLALKRWLNAEQLPFVERDLRDPAIADEAKRRTGARVVSITIIDGKHHSMAPSPSSAPRSRRCST